MTLVGRLPGAPDVPGTEPVASPQAAREGGQALVLGPAGESGALSLWDPSDRATPLSVDFLAGRQGYRLAADRARHERLVKALGRCQDDVHGVLDLTAGLARDAALMAAAGYPVSMVERQPVLHALIADALRRADGQGAAALLTLLDNGDAAALPLPAGPWHAVYLDPMFPARGKSAAVKQDLQWLQQLCPYPDEGEERRLLDTALALSARKVVVKRPRRAPPLAGQAPHHVLEGKTVRFDVYNGAL